MGEEWEPSNAIQIYNGIKATTKDIVLGLNALAYQDKPTRLWSQDDLVGTALELDLDIGQITEVCLSFQQPPYEQFKPRMELLAEVLPEIDTRDFRVECLPVFLSIARRALKSMKHIFSRTSQLLAELEERGVDVAHLEPRYGPISGLTPTETAQFLLSDKEYQGSEFLIEHLEPYLHQSPETDLVSVAQCRAFFAELEKSSNYAFYVGAFLWHDRWPKHIDPEAPSLKYANLHDSHHIECILDQLANGSVNSEADFKKRLQGFVKFIELNGVLEHAALWEGEIVKQLNEGVGNGQVGGTAIGGRSLWERSLLEVFHKAITVAALFP